MGLICFMAFGVLPTVISNIAYSLFEVFIYLFATVLGVFGFYALSVICWGKKWNVKQIYWCLKCGIVALCFAIVFIVNSGNLNYLDEISFLLLFIYALVCPFWTLLYYFLQLLTASRNSEHNPLDSAENHSDSIFSKHYNTETVLTTKPLGRSSSLNMAIEDRFPFSVLRDTSQHPITYIAKAVCISIAPLFLIAILVIPLSPLNLDGAISSSTGLLLFFMQVMFAPITETAVQLLIILGLSKYLKTQALVIIFTAFIWAFFHALYEPLWGMMVFWPFVVYSLVCVEFLKISKRKAFIMTTGVHIAQNLLAFILSELTRF